MKRIFHYFILFVFASFASACSDFLSETPDKSGSAYIYHMDQLYGLTGNYRYYQNNYIWTDLIFRGDGIEYTPYFVKKTGEMTSSYEVWNWSTDYLATVSGTGCMWEPCWDAIYGYNTVLEYLDEVIQTTFEVHQQVEAEALFGRAYFHFMLLVQYSLWNEDAPGIGYRTNTSPTDVPQRETVGYTLSRIYEDLNRALELLEKCGRTVFEPERNFRPTVPTVKALLARIDLYRGNYGEALQNAEDALAGYNTLLDFKNDPLYKVYDQVFAINLLNETNDAIRETVYLKRLTDLEGERDEAYWKYVEFYLPHVTDLYYTSRAIPVSQSYADFFDKENDERWKRFYDNNYILYSVLSDVVDLPDMPQTQNCITWETQQGINLANCHTYARFMPASSGKKYIIGLTTAEMYLIKAECLARAGQLDEAAKVLRLLRKTRFTTEEAANNIGGSLQEVLDERAREMSEVWRFFDIKRLNGADNADITIKRTVLTDPANSDAISEIEILPDDSRWALPIDETELIIMGWKQN